jgi:hypothetical protein
MAGPDPERDCLDCGTKGGMRLQNVAATAPVAIPLLYICERCHAQLTIPPAPLSFRPTTDDFMMDDK